MAKIRLRNGEVVTVKNAHLERYSDRFEVKFPGGRGERPRLHIFPVRNVLEVVVASHETLEDKTGGVE